MNKSQKIIMAIITPVIILISGYGYITNVMTKYESNQDITPYATYLNGGTTTKIDVKWNEFEITWKIWLLVFILIAIIEIVIFTKKRKN